MYLYHFPQISRESEIKLTPLPLRYTRVESIWGKLPDVSARSPDVAFMLTSEMINWNPVGQQLSVGVTVWHATEAAKQTTTPSENSKYHGKSPATKGWKARFTSLTMSHLITLEYTSTRLV